MRTSLINETLEKIPAYDRFFTVDEMNSRSKELAERYPQIARCEVVGRSKNGEDILLLTAGSGKYSATFYACPHPNEPIGSMTIDFLSTLLCEDERFRSAFDYTWYFIKCIDPDGTRLNEGWFKGPFTPLHYARNFYRPPSFLQSEWTFPIDYKTLHFHSPTPETQALMAVIDRSRPDFMFSLHNAGFGGVYYYVTRECPELYDWFRKVPAYRGLPLNVGEGETPYAVAFAPAIYKKMSTRDRYDFIEKFNQGDPAKQITGGTSAADYSAKYNTFQITVEAPYYFDPRVADTSLSSVRRKDALMESVRLGEEWQDFLDRWYPEVQDLIPDTNPFKIALGESMKGGRKALETKKRWIEEKIDPDEVATVAQAFTSRQRTMFYRNLSVGMFLRMLKTAPEQAAAKVWPALEATDQLLETWGRLLESELDLRVVPIRDLVAIQVGAGLACMDWIQGSDTIA